MNTSELLQQGLELLLHIEDEAGVLTEESVALVDNWLEGTTDKLAGIFYVRQQTRGQISILKEEEARLKSRRQAMEKLVDYLGDNAMFLLKQREAFGEEPKAKTPLYTVWVQASKSVALADGSTIEDVPEKFRVPQPDKLNKAEARQVMTEGMGIHGLELIESESVRWG